MKLDRKIGLPEIVLLLLALLTGIANETSFLPPYLIFLLTILSLVAYVLLRKALKDPITKEEKKLYAFQVKFRILGAAVLIPLIYGLYGISYLIFKDSLEENGDWFLISPLLVLLALILWFTWFVRNDPRFGTYHLLRISPKRYAFLLTITLTISVILVGGSFGYAYIQETCGTPITLETVLQCLK